VLLLMVAAFLVWKDEYLPNRRGPEILLAWESHEHGTDTVTIRNVGETTAFNVAVLDFSWSTLGWHRRIEFPSIDPKDKRTCEAQFRRDISPHNGEIGYIRNILTLPERPQTLSVSIGFENLNGWRFQRSFTLELVQAGQNVEIACRPGRLQVTELRSRNL
jgi:hypothetical protein